MKYWVRQDGHIPTYNCSVNIPSYIHGKSRFFITCKVLGGEQCSRQLKTALGNDNYTNCDFTRHLQLSMLVLEGSWFYKLELYLPFADMNAQMFVFRGS